MQHPSTPHQGHAEQNAAVTKIFRQAAAEGRHALNRVELRALLAGVGIRFDEISKVIKEVLSATEAVKLESITRVLEADVEARRIAREKIDRIAVSVPVSGVSRRE